MQAFTVGFAGEDVADERPAARAQLARAVGAEHTELMFDEDDFWRLLPQVARVVDDPAADYAMLPTYKLAEAAHQAGLKVILSGEGGDELFAGYGRYRSVMRPWWLGGRAARVRGMLDGLGVLREEIAGWRDGIAAAEARSAGGQRTRLQVAQAVDCADWLPNDLLVKLDRCLMAHAIEGRTPFLDPEVAKLAFRLPDELKVSRGLGKYLLRQWLAQTMPQAMPFARKRGFTVPVAKWIARRSGEIGKLVSAAEGVREVCDPIAVQRLFTQAGHKRAGRAAWNLLFYVRCGAPLRHIEGAQNCRRIRGGGAGGRVGRRGADPHLVSAPSWREGSPSPRNAGEGIPRAFLSALRARGARRASVTGG